MSETTERKRVPFWGRIYLVDTKLQLIITLYTLFFGISVAIFVGFMIVYMQSSMMNEVENEFALPIIVSSFVMTLLIQIIMGWYLTNKIAGPIYALKKHMTAVLQNETPEPLSFRKGDFFRDVAEDYNKVIKLLKDKTSS